MTIEQIRAALKDITVELTQARSEAQRLAMDKGATIEALNAANAKVAEAKARHDTLQASLDEMTGEQEKQLKEAQSNHDRIAQAASKFSGAGDFLSAVAKADNPVSRHMDPRLAEYLKVRSEASGQNITTDADGGYLIPPDFSDELINVAASESVLFGEVQRVPVSGNRLVVNLLDQESRKDTRAADVSQSITAIKGRNGGLLAYWTGEASAYTASQMKFIQDTTEMQKLTGLCYATDEMLQDLPAMSAYIAQGFADEFAFKIDDAILNGTGNGMPLGILATSETAAQNNGALVTIAKESGQPNCTLVLNNILKMWNAMPARNRANAKWYINQDLEILLYQLLMNTGSLTYTGKDSDAADVALSMNMGMPLCVPAGSLANSPHGTLLGRPIVPIEQANAVGGKGDISLLDLSQYRWIDKSGVNAQTSIHVRFLYDETAFKFTYRAGGKPIWRNAIEAYKGTTQRSPFVTLGARA